MDIYLIKVLKQLYVIIFMEKIYNQIAFNFKIIIMKNVNIKLLKIFIKIQIIINKEKLNVILLHIKINNKIKIKIIIKCVIINFKIMIKMISIKLFLFIKLEINLNGFL